MILELMVIGEGKWGKAIKRTVHENFGKCSSISPREISADFRAIEPKKLRLLLESKLRGVNCIFIACPPKIQTKIFFSLPDFVEYVFLEKPLVTDRDDLAFLLDMERKRRVVWVNHLEIFHPAVHAVIEDKNFSPYFVYAKIGAPYPKRSDMSLVFEYAPHMVSMLIHFFGGDIMPSRILSGVSEVPERRLKGSSLYTLEFNSASGLISRITVGNGFCRKTRFCTFFGEDYDYLYEDRVRTQLRIRHKGSLDEIDLTTDTALPLTRSVQQFIKTCKSGSIDWSSFDHAIAVSKLLLRLLELSSRVHDSV
jgi:predicted dehydrogenase